MRRFVAAVLAAGCILTTFGSKAAELCGPGFYRGSHAHCINHLGRWGQGRRWGYGYGLGFFEARPPCPYGYVWRYRACFPR